MILLIFFEQAGSYGHYIGFHSPNLSLKETGEKMTLNYTNATRFTVRLTYLLKKIYITNELFH